MKNRTITLALVACLLLAGSRTHAQSVDGTVAWIYDFSNRESSAVTTKKLGEIKNVAGKGISLDVDIFAGANLNQKARPVTGFLIGKRTSIADNVTGYLGTGFALQDSAKPSLCIGAGFAWKLR